MPVGQLEELVIQHVPLLGNNLQMLSMNLAKVICSAYGLRALPLAVCGHVTQQSAVLAGRFTLLVASNVPSRLPPAAYVYSGLSPYINLKLVCSL